MIVLSIFHYQIKLLQTFRKHALIPYKIYTACFTENPLLTILWCRCPLSAINIALNDFSLNNLLIITHIVSNIGSPRTIIGSIITAAVYVFATPSIETIASVYPKKFEPVSPINVLAGAKLNGKNPTKEPARAVINNIEIIGELLSKNIINNDQSLDDVVLVNKNWVQTL